MGKRTSEFMRSVHIKTIRDDLQQGKTMEEAQQHLRFVGVCEEEMMDLLLAAGYRPASGAEVAATDPG